MDIFSSRLVFALLILYSATLRAELISVPLSLKGPLIPSLAAGAAQPVPVDIFQPISAPEVARVLDIDLLSQQQAVWLEDSMLSQWLDYSGIRELQPLDDRVLGLDVDVLKQAQQKPNRCSLLEVGRLSSIHVSNNNGSDLPSSPELSFSVVCTQQVSLQIKPAQNGRAMTRWRGALKPFDGADPVQVILEPLTPSGELLGAVRYETQAHQDGLYQADIDFSVVMRSLSRDGGYPASGGSLRVGDDLSLLIIADSK